MRVQRSFGMMTLPCVLLSMTGVGCDDKAAPELSPSQTVFAPSTMDMGPQSNTPQGGEGPAEMPANRVPTPPAMDTMDMMDAADMMPAADPPEPADYAMTENWLCRPGQSDACAADLDTTVIEADGSATVEPFVPSTDPAVDCFYVYPTVSLDASPNSDLVPGVEEQSVVRAQFARFASQCRLFAPMYRQISLTALRAIVSGGDSVGMPDRALAYADVLAAWKHYLENDNDGRGVVLVGHSQGSSMLSKLIAEELDTAPLDERFLGAFLIGTNVLVPMDGVVGGTFQNVPLCQTPEELGCVISYASFRDGAPPPADALFATSSMDGLVAGCTNPAALGGGSAELNAYFSKDGPGTSSLPMDPWVDGGDPVETPFVKVPGLVTGECRFAETGSYLAVTVEADSSDPRTDTITGDVVTDGEVQAGWGLHLIDVHLGIGDLIDVVAAKAQAHAGG